MGPHLWFLAPFFFIGFWLIIFLILRLVFLRGFRGGCGPMRGYSAEQTLAELFAKGDITDQEYVRRLGVLRDQRKK